jgi:hypothetical protein
MIDSITDPASTPTATWLIPLRIAMLLIVLSLSRLES